MRKIPVIPDFYKNMPGKTLLNSKDLCKIFGYSNISCITKASKNKLIPDHDVMFIKDCSNSPTLKKKVYYWYLSTIRNWGKE